jgi:hypothetical protein
MRIPSIVLLVGALTGLVLTGCGGGNAGPAPADAPKTQASTAPTVDPHGAPLVERRTVVLRRDTVSPSPPGSLLHTQLMTGAMPAARTTAVVLSDEDCEPDAAGVSHCRNGLLLAGGKRIVVRHFHKMSTVPCLSPGEEVKILPS